MVVTPTERDAADRRPPVTLILRFADVGIATYGSLRVVAAPERTVTWVLEEPVVAAAADLVAAALPLSVGRESTIDAVRRALTTGSFAHPESELAMSLQLGRLLCAPAWNLLLQCVSDPRPVLVVTPTARLAQIPFAMVALPSVHDSAGGDDGPEHPRLMEMADVVMAPAVSIVHARRRTSRWVDRRDEPAVLILDPRVPGQRADSPLGSVLGRPSPDMPVARHFAEDEGDARRPPADGAAELFRRTDTDRVWLARVLESDPSRLLFVGHASAAPGDAGHAERAAIHLACSAAIPGHADAVGTHRPFTAADILGDIPRWPMPPRVAMVACTSGGDHRFDEATGMVAAMILAGAETVTATLWSLPTSAGYRRFVPDAVEVSDADPMAELIIAVDTAHRAEDAVRTLGRWQRAQMRRWRSGDLQAPPVYWGSLVTFAAPEAT